MSPAFHAGARVPVFSNRLFSVRRATLKSESAVLSKSSPTRWAILPRGRLRESSSNFSLSASEEKNRNTL